MPIARLQATFGQNSIESDSGIIRGVRVMEVGKLAMFAGDDGKAKSVMITPEHISALLGHAGNRAIPSHWSHDWHDSIADPIHARIGALKTFRKDEAGNLIADLHLSPGPHRDTALWSASNAPENMMLSAVFSYNKKDDKCIPQDFRACDLVAKGAATTALLSEKNDETPMTPKELADAIVAALADKDSGPALKTALFAEMPKDKAPDAALFAKIESEAGVTDADKNPDDEQLPALMSAVLRVSRAVSRQTKSLAADKEAILAEAKILGKAEATALLGNVKFLGGGGGDITGDATAKFNAAVKELTDRGVTHAAALRTVIDTSPKLYEATQTALFKAPVRL